MARIIRAQTAPPGAKTAGAVGAPRPRRDGVRSAGAIADVGAAQQVLVRAREEAAAIRTQALAAANQAHAEVIATANAQASAILAQARQQAAETVRRAEQDLTQLAVRIAEKIIAAELTVSPAQVQNVVRACILRAEQARRITIRVHPSDQGAVAELLAGERYAESDRMLRIELDAAVPQGGCIVETELGQIDGRIEQQLAAVAAGLAARGER